MNPSKQPVVRTKEFSAAHDGRTPPLAWRAGWTDKILLLCSSLIPLSIIITLAALAVANMTSTGALLDFVSVNRATTQIIVSILASTLASLNVYTITTLLNFATRIHLVGKPISLNMLELLSAIGNRRVATGLSPVMLSATVILVLLFGIPSILWTGALTPVITSTTIIRANGMRVPQYSESSRATWTNANVDPGECTTVTNVHGTFGDCPLGAVQSSILSKAAHASSNVSQTYAKNDKSQYSFVGRSYGVGAAVGLLDADLRGPRRSSSLLFYNYTEPGYMTQVNCFRNESLQWHLERVQGGRSGNGIPAIYYAIGMMPNADPNVDGVDFYAIAGHNNGSSIIALSSKRYYGRDVIAITAGPDYTILNRTQCEITFVPSMFQVHVDAEDKLIRVSPVNASKIMTPAEVLEAPFDPTGKLSLNIVNAFNTLSPISSGLYTSLIGNVLISNIDNMRKIDNSSDGSFTAVADSLSAIADDLLLFIGGSQFFIANGGRGDFASVGVQASMQAVRIGDLKYVFAVFGICATLLLAMVVESYRTIGWTLLPEWDFSNRQI